MIARCSFGQMTRDEYKAGAAKRDICTAEATEYTTRPGTDYDAPYCAAHATTPNPGATVTELPTPAAPLAAEQVTVLHRAINATEPIAANTIHSATLADLVAAGYLTEQWHTTDGAPYLAAVVTDAGCERYTRHDRRQRAAALRAIATPAAPVVSLAARRAAR